MWHELCCAATHVTKEGLNKDRHTCATDTSSQPFRLVTRLISPSSIPSILSRRSGTSGRGSTSGHAQRPCRAACHTAIMHSSSQSSSIKSASASCFPSQATGMCVVSCAAYRCTHVSLPHARLMTLVCAMDARQVHCSPLMHATARRGTPVPVPTAPNKHQCFSVCWEPQGQELAGVCTTHFFGDTHY